MECETTGSYDCVDGRSLTTHTPREKTKNKKNKRIKKEKSKRNSLLPSIRRGGESCIDEEFHGGFFGEFWF